MTILVEKAAFLTTIQDKGRYGYQRFGMPESGPMDWWAFGGANILVDNHPHCACVEIGFSSAGLTFENEALVAVCGAGFRLRLNTRDMPLWMAFLVRKGDRLWVDKVAGGNWSYLAVKGGIQSPMWMGSRSTYARAGLGKLIEDGDRLPMITFPDQARQLAGRSISKSGLPIYQKDPVIGVIPGPHQDRFQPSSLQAFWDQSFSLSTQSDRMGYRLTGPTLKHKHGADLVSQGMALGEIQVPGDGKPIVMMPDHPTAGGYTSIGTVAKVDLPLFAQAQPGVSQLRFQPVEVAAAQESLANAIQELTLNAQPQEDEWLTL
jgi:antagonist of KipI